MSSSFISFKVVNIGFPMLPPTCTLYPNPFNNNSVIVVVVVFPLLPVIPIVLQGASFITCSISVVIKAPLSF